MGYFGGLGAGKGWRRFLFVVEPEVLHEVLNATSAVLVITNSRVPTDHESTRLDEYVAAYSGYLRAMLESAEAAREAAMKTYMGLAASLGQFSTTPCPDSRYKLMKPAEPTVSLPPLPLYFGARRGQLSSDAMTNLYFGVELCFRRVASPARDNHEVYYETKPLPANSIFEGAKSRIQKVTKPCRIRPSSREHRTSIRITEGMRGKLKVHPGLIAAGLELV